MWSRIPCLSKQEWKKASQSKHSIGWLLYAVCWKVSALMTVWVGGKFSAARLYTAVCCCVIGFLAVLSSLYQEPVIGRILFPSLQSLQSWQSLTMAFKWESLPKHLTSWCKVFVQTAFNSSVFILRLPGLWENISLQIQTQLQCAWQRSALAIYTASPSPRTMILPQLGNAGEWVSEETGFRFLDGYESDSVP